MRVHLIGICGTAMSALACMLRASGHEVRGSDTSAYPPIGPMLKDRGIAILDGYKAENVAWGPDTVVVGNVARRDNPEAVAAQARGIPLISMPQAIFRNFMQDRKSIVVTGTHGKTTVTSMTAHILAHAGLDPSYLVGGIPLNFGSNYRLGKGPFFVIEGDEYDTAFFDKKAKFFHYNPSYAVMNALEYDHADIYPDFAKLQASFEEFAALVHADGHVAWCSHYPVLEKVVSHCRCPVTRYGLDVGDSGLRAANVAPGPSGTAFDVVRNGRKVASVLLPMWGNHNVLNALAAFGAAAWAGVPDDGIAAAMAEFQGVRRRFQVIRQQDGVAVVDDFAHHPTAVRETLAAARLRYPQARVLAAFHFESNSSRRKVFEREYSRAFDSADYVFLTYPLKKKDDLKPEEYLDPAAVMNGIRKHASGVFAFEEMRSMAAHMAGMLRPGDVVVAMSGRDFSPFYDALFEMVEHRP